ARKANMNPKLPLVVWPLSGGKPHIAQGACARLNAGGLAVGGSGLQGAAAQLVFLHRPEQRRDVALAEAFVALALDELEEHRADHQLRENLHQQPRLAAFGRAVDQDAALLELVERFAVSGQARIELLEI